LTLNVKQGITGVGGDNGSESAEFGRREGVEVPWRRQQ